MIIGRRSSEGYVKALPGEHIVVDFDIEAL